jgi:hypothetical protein
MRTMLIVIIATFPLALTACPESEEPETHEPADSTDVFDAGRDAPQDSDAIETCTPDTEAAGDCTCQCPGSDESKPYSTQPCIGEFANQVLDRCTSECLAHYCPKPCTKHEDCAPHQRCSEASCLDAPDTCGSPVLATQCKPDLAQTPCLEAGGLFACPPQFCGDFPSDCSCSCPTTDKDCPCWSDDHCQGFCDFGDATLEACSGIGACSHHDYKPRWGCWCHFELDGTPIAAFNCVC